ncbi:MAG: redoxin domain-containing protein [Candidatus Micrarchaeia archaeon]
MNIGLFSIPGLKAPEFDDKLEWINSNNKIKLKDLAGRIVVIDFWTYCCINCVHMIPILEKIQEKYENKKVVVIGVHSPKFESEKSRENVLEAITRYGIKHPVLLDSNMKTWKEYGASGWPTFVILDPYGKIAAKFSGEISFENFDRGLQELIKKYSNKKMSNKVFNPKLKKIEHAEYLRYPGKIAINKEYIAFTDSGNKRLVVLDKKRNFIKELYLNKNKNASYQSMPEGLCWINRNELLVCDPISNTIKKVSVNDELIEIVAGTGKPGGYFKPNEEHIATKTNLNSPWDLSYDGKTIYIAQSGTHQILCYDNDNTISHFAGSGHEDLEDGSLKHCCFAQPSGIFFDEKNKDIYIADSECSGIRSISIKNRFTSTVVGAGLFVFGDRVGKVSNTLLQHPMGLCYDNGIIYIADTFNNSIKAIDIKKQVSYSIISQKEKCLCKIDDPECDSLGLFEPNDVKSDNRYLYITDTNNHLFRIFDKKKKIIRTVKINGKKE